MNDQEVTIDMKLEMQCGWNCSAFVQVLCSASTLPLYALVSQVRPFHLSSLLYTFQSSVLPALKL